MCILRRDTRRSWEHPSHNPEVFPTEIVHRLDSRCEAQPVLRDPRVRQDRQEQRDPELQRVTG